MNTAHLQSGIAELRRNETSQILGCVFLNPVCFNALGADLNAFNALRCFNSDLLEIRQPDLFRLVLSMGNIVSCLRALSAYIASS
jgi:hypothetical protein